MKIRNSHFYRILNILVVLLLYLNITPLMGQEIMEDANVSLSFSDENNDKTIVAKATDKNGDAIEELELYFFVKRTFSLLPIGDVFNETDEEGIVEIEFPNDLPGDTEGNLIIITKIIESDLYNDLTLETTKKWGIPVEITDSQDEKRSLWAAAANAPLTLVVSVSLMIIAVWSIVWYIVFILYTISRIKPLKS